MIGGALVVCGVFWIFMDFMYGHVIWILCMLCVDMSLLVFYFSNACLFIAFNFISLFLYFVLSSITKKGEIDVHLGR